ncbi:MAG: AgmX/PglI C-terminal domain-containing protein [Polyangia bacterium]
MKRVLVACALLVVGCNKSATPTAQKADPQFDAKWQQATSAAEPAYIESQRGGGLLGEVRRAVDPPRSGATGEIVTGPLPDSEVASVIKRNLPAVKGCYEVEERAGTVGSGKAIVSLEIDPAGTVQTVSVDAPAFADSKLPACITARAKGWTFPKFTQGPKKFSYPFVFVGG